MDRIRDSSSLNRQFLHLHLSTQWPPWTNDENRYPKHTVGVLSSSFKIQGLGAHSGHGELLFPPK